MLSIEEQICNYPTPLLGAHLPGSTLAEVVNSRPIVILHFLRHLGCLYCKAQVDGLYNLQQQHPGFPPIIFVHQSSVEKGDVFFAKHFPGAAHISDPQLDLYRLFSIRRLQGLNLINPLMVLKGIWLTLRGYVNRVGGFGDIMILSGTFLFRQGKLAWSHRARWAGDEPNFKRFF